MHILDKINNESVKLNSLIKEFEEKKIPFIIKRPLPNGGVEYLKFADLEILA